MKRLTLVLLCIGLCSAFLVSGCQKAAQKPTVPDNQTQINTPAQTDDAEKRVMANRFSNLAASVAGVQKATVVVSNPGTMTGNAEQNMPGITLPQDQTPAKTNPNAVQQNPANNTGTDMTGLSTDTGSIPNNTTQTGDTSTNSMGEKMVVMVGLTLDAKSMQDKNMENSIKEQVKTKIMGDDKRIGEVLVTTNPELIKKLQDVAAGVIQGKPMKSYAPDIEELNKNIRGM